MAHAQNSGEKGDPIIIKKYANRRLYNTDSSKYITLDFLADLTRKDIIFKVLDAKTGEDITHNVLTQIIMDEESNGQNLLPVGFLRQLITLYGDSMRSMVPEFLETSMQKFKDSQMQVQNAIENVITSGPFGDIAKTNIELMRSARDAFVPGLAGKNRDANKTQDIAELKRQMAALQAKIDRLSGD